MNEIERTGNGTGPKSLSKSNDTTGSLEIYDRYGAMAYGIILQIIPQPHLAQEVLVSVFSSPQLQSCNSYPFTFAVCVIKLARAKAVEARRKLTALTHIEEGEVSENGSQSPQAIFDLAFRQGFTPDEVAGKLNITKSEVLRSFHEFFKTYQNA
jgi:DNA-directed RNA polymerase specialized sigma24 family protein